VVVIVPNDPDIQVAQGVGQESRYGGQDRRAVVAIRRFRLENHDGDDNRQHAIGEGLEPSLVHVPIAASSFVRPN
jgi:hypothetical protein